MRKKLQFVIDVICYDWKGKLLALMLAFTIWLYIYMVVSNSVPQLVPIQIEGHTPNLIASASPQEVEIMLTGPQRELNRFYLKPVVGKYPIKNLQLPEGQPIEIVYIPTEEFFHLPPHIYFAEPPSPPEVAVKLVHSQTKLLEIKPRIVLKSTQNYIITGISSTPGLVLAKGPSKTMAEMTFVETLPIYLPKLDKEGRLDVRGKLPATIFGNKIEYKGPHEVLVHIVIEAQESDE